MSNDPLSESQEQSPKESSPVSAGEEPSAPKLSSVEVLPSEDKSKGEMTQASPNVKKSWLPWRRPNRRDEQLSHLREGYIELLGLVRSISDHLDRQKDEKSQVSTLVESLPPALTSLENLASSQKEVTSILGNLNSHMEKTSVKDEQLLENLEGFNTALKDVSSSNQKSLGTLSQVSERIGHSDEQMKMLFEQTSQSSEAAGAMMMRLEKRVFLSNLALVILLALLLAVGVFWITKMQPQSAPVAPVEKQQLEVVAPPVESVGSSKEKLASPLAAVSELESVELPEPTILKPETQDSSAEAEEPAEEEPENEKPAEEEEIKKEEIEELDLFLLQGDF